MLRRINNSCGAENESFSAKQKFFVWITMKIKKVYNFKIISLLIIFIFSFENVVYSVSNVDNLRVPLNTRRVNHALQIITDNSEQPLQLQSAAYSKSYDAGKRLQELDEARSLAWLGSETYRVWTGSDTIKVILVGDEGREEIAQGQTHTIDWDNLTIYIAAGAKALDTLIARSVYEVYQSLRAPEEKDRSALFVDQVIPLYDRFGPAGSLDDFIADIETALQAVDIAGGIENVLYEPTEEEFAQAKKELAPVPAKTDAFLAGLKPGYAFGIALAAVAVLGIFALAVVPAAHAAAVSGLIHAPNQILIGLKDGAHFDDIAQELAMKPNVTQSLNPFSPTLTLHILP